jgi:hypothetical protein
LRSPSSKYVTGTTAGGEQAIVFLATPALHAYWFDPDGNYLRYESRELIRWSMDEPYLKRLEKRLSEARAWVKKLKLTPGPIRVKRFATPDQPSLAIRDYPLGWDGAEWGEGESRESTLKWWRGLGAFVLLWDGFEHNIDKKGKWFQ